MPKHSYSDRDKAFVYMTLDINDGNIKRTSRETGVPRATILSWKRKWAEDGIPDDFFEPLEKATDDFIKEASEVKALAVARMKEIIPTEKNLYHLSQTVGILDDKITRARGLPTQREARSIELPSPEKVKKIFQGYIAEITSAAQERSDIIDIEFEEQSSMELLKEN